MAEIHLAKTKGIAGFEKFVALKMIHPNFAEDEQFIQMLVDEAKIAVQLTHGNIAQTFDLGRVGDTYYITMEYVDGADLYKILRRGSEQDLEMPLDVCAFIGKEIASALDHAHRKRDHTGRPLGIVHRDVSPQNVLVSYSGEVKLVDFGIAKATMKARQTAVGVIKGKYYYMSPEQAWGEVIDFRSDIFSAGIVLYEMMTGQMLYLEEDLHKLLDMARKADIAPPSTLRKGIPPQLEKIVMHALAKNAGDRYQSAGDLASDLERFLHAYAPVFTASKISGMIRHVLGDPQPVVSPQEYPSIEIHEGVNATFSLDTNDLVHDGKELHDENSVIFRVADLKKPEEPTRPAGRPQPQAASPAKPAVGAKPGPKAPGNVTRAHAPTEPRPALIPGQPQQPPPGNAGAPLGKIPSIAKPAPVPAARPAAPRRANEETRQLESAPPGPNDEMSGLLTPSGQKVNPSVWNAAVTHDSIEEDLDGVGERTMITAPAGRGGGGFMMDGDEGVEATMVTEAPRPEPDTDTTHQAAESDGALEDEDDAALNSDDDEGPTLARDFTTDRPRVAARRQAPPAALAANIHAPAVSELRRPRASKRTPQQGVPSQGGPPNVLQQIVHKEASEPMPVPRAQPPTSPPPTLQPPAPPQVPAPPGPQGAYAMGPSQGGEQGPYGQAGYPQPYPGYPQAASYPQPQAQPQPGYPHPGYPPQAQPYEQQPYPGYPPQQGYPPQGYPPQGYPPQGYPPQGYPPQGYPPQGYPPQQPAQPPVGQVTPGALYQFQPATQPMSLTGQLRLFEVDELPSQYNLGAARRRRFTYLVAGLIAISVAAGVTFMIIRFTRETAPTVGRVHIESVPAGAEITYDGTRLTDKTPYTIENVPVGSRHEVKVELPRYKAYSDTVDIPKTGGEVPVMALLKPVTGKLKINSQPGGAEIWINGTNRGRTPTTLNDIDMEASKKLELRLKDYEPIIWDLTWPKTGEIDIDARFKK